MAIKQKCGTCKWLRPRSDGKPFYHANAYACQYMYPPIQWPASVAERSYNDPRNDMEGSVRGYMRPNDGKGCPVWQSAMRAAR